MFIVIFEQGEEDIIELNELTMERWDMTRKLNTIENRATSTSQWPLDRNVSSVMPKDDNEVKPGAVHRSLGIYRTVEENLGNLQLGYGVHYFK